MISIIIGTNRKNSQTAQFAHLIQQMYEAKGQATQILSLEELPTDYFHADMYSSADAMPAYIRDAQERFFKSTTKWHFVIPEYNGSYPGALKLFIDAISVIDQKATFNGKKAALTGISSGRAGNLRGMDHFTIVLQYLDVTVLPNRLPISQVYKLKDGQGHISDEATLVALDKQLDAFISF
jgi:NAD(P)H-dependent FMN reductase